MKKKKNSKRGLRFKKKPERKQHALIKKNKTRLTLESFAGFPLYLYFVHYFNCRVDLNFY